MRSVPHPGHVVRREGGLEVAEPDRVLRHVVVRREGGLEGLYSTYRKAIHVVRREGGPEGDVPLLPV